MEEFTLNCPLVHVHSCDTQSAPEPVIWYMYMYLCDKGPTIWLLKVGGGGVMGDLRKKYLADLGKNTLHWKKYICHMLLADLP